MTDSLNDCPYPQKYSGVKNLNNLYTKGCGTPIDIDMANPLITPTNNQRICLVDAFKSPNQSKTKITKVVI